MERLDDKTLKALGPELSERLNNARQRGDRRLVKFLDGVRAGIKELVERRTEETNSRELAAKLDAMSRRDNAASMQSVVDGFNGDE